MVVATADADGMPSVRTVLLKDFGPDGFVFYTNYDSRKAADLAANPRAALLMPWHPLERQIRIEGAVERTSVAESAGYFASRPHGSRLGAWASPQSRPLGSRTELTDRLAATEQRFGDGEVPLPPFWGGYRVRPHAVEFWQGRADRLHDRFRYLRSGDRWTATRLAP